MRGAVGDDIAEKARLSRVAAGSDMLPFSLAVGLLAAPTALAVGRFDTLVVADDVADPATLDPGKEFVEKNYTLLQQIFDPLVRFDADGRIEPALATDWRWLDPKTVEFKLRSGVRFHDGEAFDAECVRSSLLRYLDPKTGFPGAGFLASIEGVEVVDRHTVRIRTYFPDGILLNRLAGFVLILPSRYVAEHDEAHLSSHPIGTGAFRFL